MKLSEFMLHLDSVPQVNFIQPNGTFVPKHFHITEAGLTTKNFIDCGGTVRTDKRISLQIWSANDVAHRLSPHKLKKIIGIAQPLFNNEDLEVEIEFQTDSISRFGVDFDGYNFILTSKHTDCLAQDLCGVPQGNQNTNLTELMSADANSCCSPGGGCC